MFILFLFPNCSPGQADCIRQPCEENLDQILNLFCSEAERPSLQFFKSNPCMSPWIRKMQFLQPFQKRFARSLRNFG